MPESLIYMENPDFPHKTISGTRNYDNHQIDSATRVTDTQVAHIALCASHKSEVKSQK